LQAPSRNDKVLKQQYACSNWLHHFGKKSPNFNVCWTIATNVQIEKHFNFVLIETVNYCKV